VSELTSDELRARLESEGFVIRRRAPLVTMKDLNAWRARRDELLREAREYVAGFENGEESSAW
jgi:hypothetical protein